MLLGLLFQLVEYCFNFKNDHKTDFLNFLHENPGLIFHIFF